jgi:type IV pilus assembly protein PilQ
MSSKILVTLFLVLIVPSVCLGQIARQPAQKVSFDFVDADIRNVLRVLAEVSKKNLVMGEDVKGKVTMKLDGISTSEAFEMILKTNDLAKIEEDTVIRVMTTRRFFEEKDRDRKDKLEFLKEKEAKEKLEDEFVTQTIFLNYADAAEVEKMIKGGKEDDGKERRIMKGLLSPNGAVTLVKWNNALIIKDVRSNVDDVIRNIKQHDTPPTQVQIEARIVQANTDFSKEIGIAWGGTYKSSIGGRAVTAGGIDATGATTTAGGSYNINLPANVSGGTSSSLGGGIALAIGTAADRWALDVQLSALENDDRVRIISNPKVITSDNVPAKISQGKEIPYQTTSQNGTTTEFKLAVLSLEVTPHVSKDGAIRLKIKATKDEPVTVSSVLAIDKKEAVSEVLIRDGETVMIGGIYEITDDHGINGLPLLKDIPVLGWLFKKDLQSAKKRELLIFITPTIIKDLYRVEG